MDTTVSTLYRRLSLTHELDEVYGIIRREVRGGYTSIDEMLKNFVGVRGKFLRPALLLLSSRLAESLDEAPAEAVSDASLHLAASVEILHMASLVHDDIIDRSSTRRGKATLNTLHGNQAAVLLGDYLFSRSFYLASRFTDIDTGAYIARIVGSICEGEIRQGQGRFDFSTDFKEYHRRIMGKTAALFAVSAYIGAHQAGIDERNAHRMKKIGYNLGAAFQILDDIIDCSLSEGAAGKRSGTDILEGVSNLPMIFALRRDDGRLKKLLKKGSVVTRRTSRGKLRKTITLIRERGGVEEARKIARRYIEKAQFSIACLPACEARSQIDEYARYLYHSMENIMAAANCSPKIP
jgi:heptaprenyl diphosphate synthase